MIHKETKQDRFHEKVVNEEGRLHDIVLYYERE